jgi:hypothetical protein
MKFEKKIVLFGAGPFGKQALDRFGKDQVLCFCDNNPNLIGRMVEEKEVIGIQQLVKLKDEVYIIISISKTYQKEVYKQLCDLGLEDCILNYTFGINACKGIYSVVEQARQTGLVIYGAGFWGELTHRIFSLFNLKPICFCDDNIKKIGIQYCNTDVISLADAVQKYGNSIFIAAADDTPIIGVRNYMNNKLKMQNVYSEYSNLKIENYIFLLDTGIDIFEHYENIKFNVPSNNFKAENLNKLMIFNHMGHSGSDYFENLLDGHENILTIPFGAGINHIREAYLYRLQHLVGKELIIEICALISTHFNTSLDLSKLNSECKLARSAACRNQFGEFETRVAIDPISFAKELVFELKKKDKPSFAETIKILYAVYNNALKREYKSDEEYWIFYHMHQNNYDLNTLDNMIKESDFKRVEYLFIIREPIQHLFSCINYYTKIQECSAAMISSMNNLKNFICSDLGYMLEKKRSNYKKNVKVIRFEDLKFSHKEIMSAFCTWANIDYSETMSETTVNGVKVYFTTIGEDGKKKYITGNDPLAVKRKDFSSQMTSYDIVRLNIAFQKFKKAYGYEVDVPDFKNMSNEFLQEMFETDFKFTKTLIEIANKTGDMPRSKNMLSEGIRNLLLKFMENYEDNTEYYDYLRIEN